MKRFFCCLLFIIIILLLVVGCQRLVHRGQQSGWVQRAVSRITNQPAINQSEWIQPLSDNDNPLWGLRDGIVFGISSTEMDYKPGGVWAQGLLRIGWTDQTGQSHFFNYLGVSLLSADNKYDASEQERIEFYPDNLQFVADLDQLINQKGEASQEVLNFLDPGQNKPAGLASAAEIRDDVLRVVFRLSEFDNTKAKIYLIVEIDKKAPREIKISSYNPLEKTKSLKYINISATYGNLGRLRNLYLKDRIANAEDLFGGQQLGSWCFYPYVSFGLDSLRIAADGSITVSSDNDESGPWVSDLGSGAPYYDELKFYQYWRKYPGTYKDDLAVRVNGRENYFGGFINPCGSKRLTAGVAYENFEMSEKFYQGQPFWFGYSYLQL